jgi:hypothetical protein
MNSVLAYSSVDAPWYVILFQFVLVCGVLLFLWDCGKDFTAAIRRKFGTQESVYMRQERFEVERNDDYDRQATQGYVVEQVANKMRQFERKALPPGK